MDGRECARLRIGVKEMIGGFEWWVREGLPVETDGEVRRADPDPLVAVVPGRRGRSTPDTDPTASSPRPVVGR